MESTDRDCISQGSQRKRANRICRGREICRSLDRQIFREGVREKERLYILYTRDLVCQLKVSVYSSVKQLVLEANIFKKE